MGYIDKVKTVLLNSTEKYTKNKTIDEIIHMSFMAGSFIFSEDHTDILDYLLLNVAQNNTEDSSNLSVSEEDIVTILSDILVLNDIYNNNKKYRDKIKEYTLCNKELNTLLIADGIIQENEFSPLFMIAAESQTEGILLANKRAKEIINAFYSTVSINYDSIIESINLFYTLYLQRIINVGIKIDIPKSFYIYCTNNEYTIDIYNVSDDSNIDSSPSGILTILSNVILTVALLGESRPSDNELLLYLYNYEKITNDSYTLTIPVNNIQKRNYGSSMFRYNELFKHIKLTTKDMELDNSTFLNIANIFADKPYSLNMGEK